MNGKTSEGISLTTSGYLAGRVLTVSVDTVEAAPKPSLKLVMLTIDGASALNEVEERLEGDGPWRITLPSGSETKVVRWQVRAENRFGSVVSKGLRYVPADIYAPKVRVELDQGVYYGSETITEDDLLAVIEDSGGPVLRLESVSLVLKVDGVVQALPYTCIGGEVLTVEGSYSHVTGDVIVVSQPLTVSPGVAPTLEAGADLDGNRLTVYATSFGGSPAPSVSIEIRLDGVERIPTLLAPGVWELMIPESTEDQLLVWTVTAVNGVLPHAVVGETLGITGTGPVAVAPTLTVSAVLADRTLTLAMTQATGVPAPTVTAAIIVDGVPGDLAGTGPWTYTVPSSTADTQLNWVMTAANGTLPNAEQTGEVVVPANLRAPVIGATSDLVDRTVTVTAEILGGVPTPTLSIVMTQNGVPVTPTGSNPWIYTVPATPEEATILWTVTADNGIDPDAVVTGSEALAAVLQSPSISATDSKSGRTITVTAEVLGGNPPPGLTIEMTENGVAVTPTGTNPWSYTVPGRTTDASIEWTVRGINGVLPDGVVSGGELVVADLVPPQITAEGVVSGRTVTVTATVTAGQPVPELTIDMTANGAAVSPTGTNPWSYTVPDDIDDVMVDWDVTASNGVAPDAIQNGSHLIDANISVPEVEASDSLTGRTLTVTVSNVAGVPSPELSFALTANGVAVTPSGTGPWTYTVPDNSANIALVWTITATNAHGTDVVTGTRQVAANLAAPAFTLTDSLSGRTLTLTASAVTGQPAPSLTLTALTLDGVNVLANATGTGPWTYEVPSSLSIQNVAWTVTADNDVEPNALRSGSRNVSPNWVAPQVSLRFARGSYTDGMTLDVAEISPSIVAAGTPALTLADLTLSLKRNGSTVAMPRVLSLGDEIVGRADWVHASGPGFIETAPMTVGAAPTGTVVELIGTTIRVTSLADQPALTASVVNGQIMIEEV